LKQSNQSKKKCCLIPINPKQKASEEQVHKNLLFF
jgi:hypothetical protein